MHFSQHDLDQISKVTLDLLSPEQRLSIVKRIHADLIETRALLAQQSNNKAREMSNSPLQHKFE